MLIGRKLSLHTPAFRCLSFELNSDCCESRKVEFGERGGKGGEAVRSESLYHHARKITSMAARIGEANLGILINL